MWYQLFLVQMVQLIFKFIRVVMWNWKWNNFQPTPLGKAFFLVSDWQKCKLKFTHFPPLFAPCSPVPLNDNVASPSASTTPPILCYCCWCCCCFPVNMHSRRSKSKKNVCMVNSQSTWISFWLLKRVWPEMISVCVAVFSAVDFSFSLNFFSIFVSLLQLAKIFIGMCVRVLRLLFWLFAVFTALPAAVFWNFSCSFEKTG